VEYQRVNAPIGWNLDWKTSYDATIPLPLTSRSVHPFVTEPFAYYSFRGSRRSCHPGLLRSEGEVAALDGRRGPSSRASPSLVRTVVVAPTAGS
jgi:hypothetical protein